MSAVRWPLPEDFPHEPGWFYRSCPFCSRSLAETEYERGFCRHCRDLMLADGPPSTPKFSASDNWAGRWSGQ